MHAPERRWISPASSWGARFWLQVVYRAVGLFFRYWCRLRIEGAEHIPLHGGVVIASNHISLIDPVFVAYSIMATRGVQVVWAPAKMELFQVPLLGPLIASLGAFPVRRGQGDLRAIRRMVGHMQTEKLMLFPEGTRSRDGRLGEGKRTVGKLLHDVRPVVIPAAVWGTDGVLPRGSYRPRFRPPIGVRFGPPLDLQRYYVLPGTKATATAIVQTLMQAIAALLEEEKASMMVQTPETKVQELYDDTPRA